MPIPPLRERPAFAALTAHYEKIKARHFRELFDEDPKRGERASMSRRPASTSTTPRNPNRTCANGVLAKSLFM